MARHPAPAGWPRPARFQLNEAFRQVVGTTVPRYGSRAHAAASRRFRRPPRVSRRPCRRRRNTLAPGASGTLRRPPGQRVPGLVPAGTRPGRRPAAPAAGRPRAAGERPAPRGRRPAAAPGAPGTRQRPALAGGGRPRQQSGVADPERQPCARRRPRRGGEEHGWPDHLRRPGQPADRGRPRRSPRGRTPGGQVRRAGGRRHPAAEPLPVAPAGARPGPARRPGPAHRQRNQRGRRGGGGIRAGKGRGGRGARRTSRTATPTSGRRTASWMR